MPLAALKLKDEPNTILQEVDAHQVPLAALKRVVVSLIDPNLMLMRTKCRLRH